MWSILLYGLILGCEVNGLSDEDTYLSPTGLVFMKEDKVIVTGDSWSIVMVINASQHLENALELKEHLQRMETEMKQANLLNDVFKLEMERLNFIVDSLLKANEALFDMLAKGRSKRDIFSNIRLLFGAASNDDVDMLSNRVSELQNRVVEQQSFLQYQMSITKTLNKKVEENSRKLSELTDFVNNEIQRVNNITSKLRDNVQKLQVELFKYSNLSTCFRLFESIGLHSLILTNSLQAGLEMAAEGKLSFSLISAKELQQELIKVSSSLPFGLKLVSGLRLDEMYKYREVGEVIAIAQDELIVISIKLPLLSEDRGFNLYRVHSVPIKDGISGKIIRIQPDSNYFVVSNDKQLYGFMDFEDLEKCKGKSPTVCPATLTLTTKYAPTCLSSVFFKEKEMMLQQCKQSVLVKDHRPIWLPDKRNKGWIYSVAKPTKATLHCGEKFTEDIELDGTNILANVSHCKILGQDFKLFRSNEGISYSNGTFSLSTTKPLKPIIILNENIAEQLADNGAVDKAVEELRNQGFVKEGQGQSEEVSMEMLLSRMETTSEPPSPSSWKIIVIPACVSLVVSIAACYIVLYYDTNYIKRKNPFVRRNRRPIEEDPGKALKE